MTPGSDGRESEGGLLSVFALVGLLLRGRRTILVAMLVPAAVTALLVVLAAPTYTSSASFTPQPSGRPSSATSLLAGRFGIDLGQGRADNPTESPQFYAELLRSRRILGPLLDEPVPRDPDPGSSGAATTPLLELIGVAGDSPEARREAGIRWLEARVDPQVTRETGIVRFTVTTGWPQVSERLAQRLLDLVGEFNLGTRQTQAGAERRFVEARIEEAERVLADTEGELRAFLEDNRQFGNSPELSFEYERLQRRVALQQELLAAHRQTWENARIDEVRDTPLVTVVEVPERPAYPDPRRLAFRTILAGVLGGFLGAALVLGRHALARQRLHEDEGFVELRDAWADTLRELRPRRRSL